MATLDALAAVLAMADGDDELPDHRLAGDFGLELPEAVVFDDRPAADRAGVGQGHRDGLLDLFGRGRGPMAMSAVGVAACAAGTFGVGLGFAFAEGRGLPFANTLGLVKQAGEFVPPPLQFGDASLEGLASGAVRLGHAAIIGTRAACRCPFWR
jgi:hypothetical protein